MKRAGLAATTLALLIAAPAAGAGHHRALCFGEHATVSGDSTVLGTPGDDVIIAKPSNAIVQSGLGDDLICAEHGVQILDGGPGDDAIDAGTGSVFAYGGPGDDLVKAGPGGDDIFDGPGADRYRGGRGKDLVYFDHAPSGVSANLRLGGAVISGVFDRFRGVEGLSGSRFSDYLIGDGARDEIAGGAGKDRCDGEARTSCERRFKPSPPFHFD